MAAASVATAGLDKDTGSAAFKLAPPSNLPASGTDSLLPASMHDGASQLTARQVQHQLACRRWNVLHSSAPAGLLAWPATDWRQCQVLKPCVAPWHCCDFFGRGWPAELRGSSAPLHWLVSTLQGCVACSLPCARFETPLGSSPGMACSSSRPGSDPVLRYISSYLSSRPGASGSTTRPARQASSGTDSSRPLTAEAQMWQVGCGTVVAPLVVCLWLLVACCLSSTRWCPACMLCKRTLFKSSLAGHLS